MSNGRAFRAANLILVLLVLSACGSAKGGATQDASATANASKKNPGGPGSAGGTLGVNVAGFQGSRPFMNLIYNSSWVIQDASGGYSEPSASSLDSNGWVKSAPAGARVIRDLAAPLNAGKFICRYQGNGTLNVAGSSVSNVTTAAGETRFSLAATYPNPQSARLTYTVDPANYIRNIDCREVGASTTATLTPELVSALSVFSTVRFMKWQVATEGNGPVSWATRNKPGDGDYGKNDGVPIEVIVGAANQAGSNLFVTVPWNADDDYITKFATYVRDNLAANRRVYVEVSNEVWNGGYAVAAQAAKEAQTEGLASATGSGNAGALERYAEKTKQVMNIWSTVFAGQNSRLVRVASWQHVSPFYSNLLLQYLDLSHSVDALATAPYFGYEATGAMSLDQIMSALPGQVSAAVNFGVQQKAVAQQYGLQYITYEAGQAVVLPTNVPLEQQVQRDPRMHDAYQQFMTGWQSQIGEGLTLFALDGQIGQYGGWGLSEYVGQPVSQAPKLKAAYEFLGVKRAP
jgi:hypothetical protein